ncbi:TonB-dependent receptor plug domain-containing protein [Chitinophaga lutea]
MQYSKILLSGFLCLLCTVLRAQHISGTVTGDNGQPVPFATVKIQQTTAGVAADEQGRFRTGPLPAGRYTLEVSAVGFATVVKKVSIPASGDAAVKFRLEASTASLREVAVLGRTANQEANRQAYNITSIDAKKLHNTTLDLSHALDRVSGVRVRENGGVGSSINFAINGFSGNQVRFFLDGIPMDNFGSSFQLNNIPVNFADRVEVYKGVVPVWLGSDALGGAVNIVTGNRPQNYIDVSYAYGSFNTHRSVINGALTSRSGFTVQLSAFQNYSDNNYKVTLDVADINTGQYYPGTTVRRFHDTYHNETVVANVGVTGKKYADKLLLGITFGQNYKEIQTGARMVSVFGAWHRRGDMIMPTLKYQKKDLFIKGLDVTLNGNYNLGSEQNIDTAFRRYDWFGNFKQYSGLGGERSRTMYKFSNNVGIGTATVSYRIDGHHSLALNNVFTSFDRKGKDPLYPEEEKYEHPQQTYKNIFGIGYKYDLDERWSATVFGKHISQRNIRMASYNPTGNWGDVAYKREASNVQPIGYGLAASFQPKPALQFKLSYEKSNRMPENYEIFGDPGIRESNFSLRPEQSDNVNIGASYNFRLHTAHRFSLSASGIYRYSRDFIYDRLNNNQSMLVSDNLDGVTTAGGEAEVRYSWKNMLAAGVNFTYQNIRNQRKYEPGITGVSPLYKDRIPNIPYMYGNADASLFLHDVGAKGNTLSVGYNLLYVHPFYLYWPSRGGSEDKYTTEAQLAHDANIVYALRNGRYNIALECRNLTDDQLFDNFSLQKPGRSFTVKLRYFFSKS